MLEPLDLYDRRFRKRFFVDATPWARDNIIWGIVVLIVPPLAAFLRDPQTTVDWVLIKNSLILYAFALAVYALAYLRLTAKRLDADRDSRETTLAGDASEQDQTIKERDEAIRVLQEKPKRSAADQYHYDKAKTFLENKGPKFVTALRHLSNCKTLTYSSLGITMNTQWPSGMDRNEAIPVYDACLVGGLISMSEYLGPHPTKTYSIAPKMEKALDELLYEERGLAGLTGISRK